MKKYITKVIYTDNPYDFNEEEIRQDLIDLEENEDPSEDDCWEAWRWQNELEWDEVSYEAKREEGIFIIIGTLGLWNGNFRGSCMVKGNLLDAFSKCLEDYNRIYMYNKQLHVEATHHDGTNNFVIKKLTERGENYLEEHGWEYDDAEMNRRLFTNSHYSHHIDYFSKLYGWYGCTDN